MLFSRVARSTDPVLKLTDASTYQGHREDGGGWEPEPPLFPSKYDPLNNPRYLGTY